jgi:hypothetical protein
VEGEPEDVVCKKNTKKKAAIPLHVTVVNSREKGEGRLI